jgi:hypothetical protein
MDFDAAINKLERNHSQLRKVSRNKAASQERLQRQAAQRRKLAEERKQRERLQQRKLHHAKQYMDHWDNTNVSASASLQWQLQPTSIHGEGDKIALPASVLEKLVRNSTAGGGGYDDKDETETAPFSFGPHKPLTFRIGIRNPQHDNKDDKDNNFPSSSSMKALMEQHRPPDDDLDGNTTTTSPMDLDTESEKKTTTGSMEIDDNEFKSDAYLEELQHQFSSYTYCTVVEFTQEEGNIGLPKAVAQKLLMGQMLSKQATADDPRIRKDVENGTSTTGSSYVIPSKRTVDPTTLPGYVKPVVPEKASMFEKGDFAHHIKKDLIVKVTEVHLDNELVPFYNVQTLDGSQEIQTTDGHLQPLSSYGGQSSDGDGAGETSNGADSITDDTPGHMNYGAFDVPAIALEVTLVSKPLPKGTDCTLTPTLQAFKHGWNDVPDIKAALEQSLTRTRATLCVNDTITCWHKGKAFELTVSHVTPDTYGAISCINTDIEVDIGYNPLLSRGEGSGGEKMDTTTLEAPPKENGGYTLGGRVLSSSLAPSSQQQNNQGQALAGNGSTVESLLLELPEEPEAASSDNVATILVRAPPPTQFSVQRRFDVSTATVNHLFKFATANLMLANNSTTNTTRTGTGAGVPLFQLVTRFPRQEYQLADGDKTLRDVGLQTGQHLLLIERL